MKINAKFIVVFCAMAIFLPHNLAAQENPWTLTHKHGNNQGAETEKLSHIQFVDNLNGWAVGEKGLIKQTIDGGVTWKNLMSPTNKHLTKSYFLDAKTGWVFGTQGALFKTTDAGQTWEDISVVGSTAFVRDLFFTDENRGWMIHEDQVYQSKDGGVTWSDLELPNPSEEQFYFSQLAFRDKKTGWLVHSDGLFQTADGGLTWQENKTLDRSKYNSGYFSTINLLSENNIALVLNQPDYLLFSNDHGKTWKMKKGPMENPENGDAIFYYSITALPDNSLLFYGSIGWRESKIYRSIDTGDSWHELKMPLQNAVSSLHFVNDQIGFVVGNEGLLKTEDGGKSWGILSERPQPQINNVYFSSPNIGFAVGNESTILYTKNKGETWEKIEVQDPNLVLTNLHLLTSSHSWITGSRGSLLRMQNDESKWSYTSLSEDVHFNSEAEREMLKDVFPDGKNHFVIQKILNFNLNELWLFAKEPQGLSISHIFRSIDGGTNWAKVPSEKEYSFVDFVMSSRIHFYAIDRKKLYISNDQCLTWQEIPLPKSSWFNLRNIQRVPNLGYVIQTDRSLLFYNQSQNTISEQPFKNNLKIKATFFRNAELGWGITDNQVYETLNGGETWIPITDENAIHTKLTSLTFFDDNNIWVYGQNGFIALLNKEVPKTNPADDFKEEMKNRLNNFINRERD